MRYAFIPTIIIGVMVFAPAAHAQSLLASFSDWSVMKAQDEDAGTLCYIGTKAASSKGTFTKRSEPFLLVTQRSQYVDEVSVSSGFPYKMDSATVSIEGRDFSMFTEDETAWAPDAKQDKQMIEAMKKAHTIVLRGTSQKDTTAEDTFSLKGFTAAYNDMKKRCAK